VYKTTRGVNTLCAGKYLTSNSVYSDINLHMYKDLIQNYHPCTLSFVLKENVRKQYCNEL